MDGEREWALLLSGKFDQELQQVKEIGQKVVLYSSLRYIAAEEGWKQGWAAHFFKSLYGIWPEREWEAVPPIYPTDEARQMVSRRQRSYRLEMSRYFAERRAQDERGVEDGEIADVVFEGSESTGGLCDSGRVQGMEEQDERGGELCEADERSVADG